MGQDRRKKLGGVNECLISQEQRCGKKKTIQPRGRKMNVRSRQEGVRISKGKGNIKQKLVPRGFIAFREKGRGKGG